MITANCAVYSCLAIALLTLNLSQVPGQVGKQLDPAGLGPRAIFMLLMQQPVRRELSLTADQAMAIRPTIQEFQQEVNEFVSKWPDIRVGEAEAQQRQEKLKEITAKYRAKLKEQISPEQLTRLQQLHWQFLGSVALLEDDVAKTLMIDPEQQSKIRLVIKEFDLSPPTEEANTGSDKPQQSFDERLKQRDKAALLLLSPEQADRFQILKGKEFDFSTLQRAPRRR